MRYEPILYQYEHDTRLPWRLKKSRLIKQQHTKILDLFGRHNIAETTTEYMFGNISVKTVSDNLWPYTVGWIELLNTDINLKQLKIPGRCVLLAHGAATASPYPIRRLPTSVVICARADTRETATLLALTLDTIL